MSAHGISDQGIKVALEKLASRTSSDLCKISVDGDEPAALGAQAHLHLFRITQEAIQNAMRHGAASRINIYLAPDPQHLLLVRDNGKGFDPQQYSPGMGLQSLRQRAALLGGQLKLDSEPGRTEIAITI